MSDTYAEKTGTLSKLPEDGGNLGYLKISAPAAGTLTALGPEHHQAPTDPLPRASKETHQGCHGLKALELNIIIYPTASFPSSSIQMA